MKSDFSQDTDLDHDEDDDIEVESTGPMIASAKKSKVLVIAASAILISVVIYFLFFKEEKKIKEDLVEVSAPRRVTPNEEGKAPFEIEVQEKKFGQDEILNLDKPIVPDVPSLPSLPEGSVLENDFFPQEVPNPLEPQIISDNTSEKNPSLLDSALKPLAPVVPVTPAIPGSSGQANLQMQSNQGKDLDPRYAPIIVFSGVTGGSPSRGVGYEQNIVQLNKNPIDELEETTSGVTATYIANRANTIAQGKLLTAVLETAINTEVPGLVRAIISRDVYGESGNKVLLPRGSRLFGSYSSKITQGQARVEIGWTRLIRPDGVDLAIDFNASDQFGRAGIAGKVDSKYSSIIANSLLTSILAVGGVIATEKLLDTGSDTATTTTDPTTGTTTSTGSASNSAIYDVSKTIIDTVGDVIGKNIDINPVIRVSQGTRITVIVNSDITVPFMNER